MISPCCPPATRNVRWRISLPGRRPQMALQLLWPWKISLFLWKFTKWGGHLHKETSILASWYLLIYIYIIYYLLGLTFIKSLISFGLTLLKKTCWGRIWYVLDRLLTGWCLFCHQVGSIFRVPNLDLIAICENSCMGKFHDMVTFCRLPIKVAKEIQRFFGSATNLLWIVLRILLSPLHSKRSEKTWRIYPLVI